MLCSIFKKYFGCNFLKEILSCLIRVDVSGSFLMPGIFGTLRYCFLGSVTHICLGYGSDVLQGLGSQMYLKVTK